MYTYIDSAECTIYVNICQNFGIYTDLKMFIFQGSIPLSQCPFMGPKMLPYTYTLITILQGNNNSQILIYIYIFASQLSLDPLYLCYCHIYILIYLFIPSRFSVIICCSSCCILSRIYHSKYIYKF